MLEKGPGKRRGTATRDRDKARLEARVRELEEAAAALRRALGDMEHERRRAEQARREWVTALDALEDPVFIHDQEMRVLRANLAYARRAGLDIREVIGRRYWEMFPKLVAPLPGCCKRSESGGCIEDTVRLESGEEFVSSAHPIYDDNGKFIYSLHLLHDVTGLRRTEAEQRTLSEALRQAAESVVVLDAGLRITYLNPAFYALFGYAPDDILGRPVSVLAVPGQEAAMQPEGVVARLREHGSWKGEALRRAKDGSAIPILISASAIRDAQGTVTGYVATYLDLREIRQAERALREREQRYRALTENVSDLITLIDRDAVVRYTSPSVERLLGYDRDELIGHNAFELIHPEDAPQAMAVMRQALRTPGAVYRVEFRARRKDGAYRYFEAVGRNLLDDPSVGGAIVNSRDVTEHKEHEASLRKVNRALKVLSAGDAVLVHTFNEQQLLDEICRVIVIVSGYRVAWVGVAMPGENPTVRAEAMAGIEREALETYCLKASDGGPSPEPLLAALRSGEVQVVQDVDTADVSASCRELMRRHDIASAIYFPLHENGRAFAILSICAQERNAFDEEEIALLTELANDLAYGLRALRVRAQRDQALTEHRISLEKLRANMEDTITAIAATVEMRDPYTAGHERRVAALATAIAQELKLPAEQIKGIHFGALIHDLGKIRVPAEILSKPGRLTRVEYELIQGHAQAGYEILKGIKFPWPVALMVLQHHERIDGSGYPQGLRGDALLIESKILGVADTVEAMYSHRPYRPARGVDAALQYLREARDRALDARVVDACLRLFTEKGFSFPPA